MSSLNPEKYTFCFLLYPCQVLWMVCSNNFVRASLSNLHSWHVPSSEPGKSAKNINLVHRYGFDAGVSASFLGCKIETFLHIDWHDNILNSFNRAAGSWAFCYVTSKSWAWYQVYICESNNIHEYFVTFEAWQIFVFFSLVHNIANSQRNCRSDYLCTGRKCFHCLAQSVTHAESCGFLSGKYCLQDFCQLPSIESVSSILSYFGYLQTLASLSVLILANRLLFTSLYIVSMKAESSSPSCLCKVAVTMPCRIKVSNSCFYLQIAKLCIIPCTCVLEAVWLKRRFPAQIIASIALVLTGVAIV